MFALLKSRPDILLTPELEEAVNTLDIKTLQDYITENTVTKRLMDAVFCKDIELVRCILSIPDIDANVLEENLALLSVQTTREIEALVESKIDVERQMENGMTYLHYAVQNDRLDIIKRYTVSTSIRNKCGNSLLHLSAKLGRYNIAKFLVESKANVNAKNNNLQIPLHMASLYGHLDIYKMLVRNKSDKTAKDKNGLLPEEPLL